MPQTKSSSHGSTSFSTFLEVAKSRVEAVLTEVLADKTAQAAHIDTAYARLLEEVAVLIKRGGKRLRPALTILAYEGYGGGDARAIARVAAGQELLHAFMLIHDDIIDRDTLRWGGPNLAGRYLAEFQQNLPARDARHHAATWALLGGDICFNLAQELLLTSGFAAERAVEAAACLHRAVFETMGGELLDVALAIERAHAPSEQQLLRVPRYKTASYSLWLPLITGAVLAAAPLEQRKTLERLAIALGIAYQLQDDMLGVFGDEQTLGKPILTDLREGKQTLLMHYAAQAADPAQQKTLRHSLGNPKATLADLELVRQIIIETGARDKVRQLIREHHTQATALLPALQLNAASARLLREGIDFIFRRER